MRGNDAMSLQAYRVLHVMETHLYKFLERIAFVLMLSGLASVVIQVFHRYIVSKVDLFTFSILFTDELARYSIICVVYLTLPICMKEGSQPAVDILHQWLPAQGKVVLYFLIKAIIFFCLVVLLVYAVHMVRNSRIFTSPMLRLPGPFLYSMPLTAVVLMILQLVTEVLGVACGQHDPFGASPKAGDTL